MRFGKLPKTLNIDAAGRGNPPMAINIGFPNPPSLEKEEGREEKEEWGIIDS